MRLVSTGPRLDGTPLADAVESWTHAPSSAGPWLLVTDTEHEADARGLAARVLAGQVATFGLRGLAVLDPDAPALTVGREDDGLPVARVPAATSASALTAWWADDVGHGPRVPDDVAALLGSSRVSDRTRGIHARRALPDDPTYAPRAMSSEQLVTLRLLADLVVPQDGPPEHRLDLAARVDAQLAAGIGDGWRHVDLPPDPDAYRESLDALAVLAEQDDERQQATVAALEDHPRLSLWFADARVDLVRAWLAHPATMARIGYDGFATGDDEPVGFTVLAAGVREPWEPAFGAGT